MGNRNFIEKRINYTMNNASMNWVFPFFAIIWRKYPSRSCSECTKTHATHWHTYLPTACGVKCILICIGEVKYISILHVSVAEQSKALVLGTRPFGFVGSSPASAILLFDWKVALNNYNKNRPQIWYFVKDFSKMFMLC